MLRINKNLFYKIFGDVKVFQKLIKNKYFYISILVFIGGIASNFLSQTYLNNFESVEGKFPPLYDLILNHIPYIPLGYIYDWCVFISIIIFIVYVVYTREYKKIPYFFMIFGIFMIFRSIFIVLTPLGNPINFNGTNSRFKGFSKYELGLYPSGHTASIVNYFLLSKYFFKVIFFGILVLVIISLFLTRAHYSIDVLSGIIFAYAIYSFGEKYLYKFKLGTD
jgi:hypothetical protein